MGRGKRQRLAEKRRQESLVKMSVVSGSTKQHSDDVLSMAGEVQHCHAALLYGDEVTLISPRSALMKAVADEGSFTGPNLVRFMARMAPHLGPEHAPVIELARQIVDFPKRGLITPGLRKAHSELMDGLLGSIASNEEEMVEKARGIVARSGFNQLQVAIDKGILSIHDLEGADISAFILHEADPVVAALMVKIQEVLSAGNQYPLFDDDVSNLVRLGMEAGIFTRVPLSRKHGSDAAMASGLFDFLPNFPHANTSEILDIRQALDKPLRAFRRGVRELSSEIDEEPESPQFGAAIEDCWNLQVRPALDEIEEAILENSSLRDLLGRSIRDGASLPGLTAAATLGASYGASTFGVVAGPMATVPLAAGTAIGLSVAAVRAYMEQGKALKEQTGAQFYFLYGTKQRLRLAS